MTGKWGWNSRWPAPAKLNLFLHVTGQRADGYHLLQTAFRLIDLCDELVFSPRGDGRVRLVQRLPGVAEGDDLTERAARALQEATGTKQGVDIHLDKRLPMGGGIGGGSSDAATTLMALNRLWGCGLDRRALMALAIPLGADVPVFVLGQNAFAEGIGEALTPLALPAASYVLAKPDVAVPTPVVFRDSALCRNTPSLDPKDWRPGQGHNDLEAVAVNRFPEVGEALAILRRYRPARMTGSGACVFAECNSFAEAETAAAACRDDGLAAWACRGLEEHPLRGLVPDGCAARLRL